MPEFSLFNFNAVRRYDTKTFVRITAAIAADGARAVAGHLPPGATGG
jgi:hypothetical protein